MLRTEPVVRRSVSLPASVARRVRALAKRQKTSANRVLVDLLETGLESKAAERERFLALAAGGTASPTAGGQAEDGEEQGNLASGHRVSPFGCGSVAM